MTDSTAPTCTYVTNGKTFAIAYNERYDLWGTTLKEGIEVTNQSLPNLKAVLDRRTSPAAAKVRIVCIYCSYGTGTALDVVATSVQRKKGMVRISKPKGKSSWQGKGGWDHVQREYLFEPSPANREIIAQRDALMKQANALQEQARTLAKQLTKVDVSELDKYAE